MSQVEKKSLVLSTWTLKEKRQKINVLRMNVKTLGKKYSKLKPRMKHKVNDKNKAVKGH